MQVSTRWQKYFIKSDELRKGWRVYGFLRPYRWLFAIGLACLLATTLLLLYIPYGIRFLIDAANADRNLSRLTPTGYWIAGLIALQAVFTFFRVWIFEEISHRVLSDIRKSLFSKLLQQPFSFFESNRSAELNSRLTTDVQQLHDALSINLATLFQNVITPVLCFPLLFQISPKLTLYALLFFPALVIGLEIFGRNVRILSRRAQDALAEANVVSQERLQLGDIIKIFGNETYEAQRFDHAVDSVLEVHIHAARLKARFMGLLVLLMAGGTFWILSSGLRDVANGDLTIGALLSFLTFLLFAAAALGGWIEGYAALQRTIGAASRVMELMEPPFPAQMMTSWVEVPVQPSIHINNIRYTYPNRTQPALHGISLNIPYGSNVVIAGESGAGKSTLIKLLLGVIKPEEGSITINDIDLHKIPGETWRNKIGFVPQDTTLFGGTVAENIEFGKPGATRAELITAAKAAYAYDFIEALPQQFDTVVGERGMQLSGGQRQRIAIARAILRQPEILILDEATSSLDAESDFFVKKALSEQMAGRTMITIAHREKTIREAKHLILLSHGTLLSGEALSSIINLISEPAG